MSLFSRFTLVFRLYQRVYRGGNSKMSSLASGMNARIVWVDCEMTGLDVDKDHLIEMACLVTDAQLNVVAEGPSLIIHQTKEVMDAMGDWCQKQHGQSGLTQKVLESRTSLQDAESQMLQFVQENTPAAVCPLAGNSVHADRIFLAKYMPRFTSHLHYRIVDVSTIKELCRRWYPDDFKKAPRKKLTHRALDDIRESIQELRYYRQTIFRK